MGDETHTNRRLDSTSKSVGVETDRKYADVESNDIGVLRVNTSTLLSSQTVQNQLKILRRISESEKDD